MFVSRFIVLSLLLLSLTSCRAQKPVIRDPEHVITRYESSIHHQSSIASSSFPPTSMLIRVPFQPQAPFAVWDDLHKEACEEMSFIMLSAFVQGRDLSKEQAEQELHDMIRFQKEHGYSDDITLAELTEIAREISGIHLRIIDRPSAEMLRSILRKGTPILAPMAGQHLHNPFFRGDGPPYHMLLIIGYDEHGFITNDPGTRRGEQYWYRNDVIMNSIHDFTGSLETIAEGTPRVAVIKDDADQ